MRPTSFDLWALSTIFFWIFPLKSDIKLVLADDKNVEKKSSASFFENCIWLNTSEAAEYLRTTPKQLRKWVYQRKVRAYRLLGRSLRFKKSEIAALIRGG